MSQNYIPYPAKSFSYIRVIAYKKSGAMMRLPLPKLNTVALHINVLIGYMH